MYNIFQIDFVDILQVLVQDEDDIFATVLEENTALHVKAKLRVLRDPKARGCGVPSAARALLRA